MGAENDTRPNDFSDTPIDQTTSFSLDNNLYWNGGFPIPSDPNELINYTFDNHSLISDPMLPAQSRLTLPRWVPASGLFADGSTSIRQVFTRMAGYYGREADSKVKIFGSKK
jgi:hypothetical protein